MGAIQIIVWILWGKTDKQTTQSTRILSITSRQWSGLPQTIDHMFLVPELEFPENFIKSIHNFLSYVANKQTNYMRWTVLRGGGLAALSERLNSSYYYANTICDGKLLQYIQFVINLLFFLVVYTDLHKNYALIMGCCGCISYITPT